MGGVRSDGQLYGMSLTAEPERRSEAEPQEDPQARAEKEPEAPTEKRSGRLSGDLRLDDLLLPGIALLLLSGERENDDLLILLIALLFLL